MNSTNNIDGPINPLFVEYTNKNEYFRSCLFISAFIFGIIAFFGIIFNLSVCIITAKYRKYYITIKSNTGILIALASFFEILHQISHIIFLIKIIFFGMDFIPYKQSLLILTPSMIGVFGVIFMFITLSIDRLLAILIPITYRNFKQLYYIIIQVFFILIYVIYGLFIMYMAKILTPNWMITGFIGDLFTAPLNMNLYYSNSCITIFAIIIYLIIGILIKFKTDTTDERIKKMYLSLFLIIFVNIGGYLICNVSYAILVHSSIIKVTPVNIWFWCNFSAIFLNIAAASIGPILYINSGEYKLAFNRAFTNVKKLLNLNKSTINGIADKNKLKINPVNNNKLNIISPVSG